ncbi:MAG: hypothetical protein AB7P21_20295 [Lautropia sp.]
MRVRLQRIAHARSGDKGDISNIAVFAYDAAFYPALCEQLTADALKAHYRGAIRGEVLRYEAPNLLALNFVAHGALGGGVSRSLGLDNYGKALSAAILGFVVDVPDALAPRLRGGDGERGDGETCDRKGGDHA